MRWSLQRFRGLARLGDDSTWIGVVLGILLTLLWNWLSDGLADEVRERSLVELLTWGSWKGEYTLFGLLTVSLVWMVGRFLLRQGWRGGWVSFRAIPAPPAQGLVLFLNPPGEAGLWENFQALRGDLRSAETRARLGSNPLRLPLEAIAHHLPELEQVLILDANPSFRDRFLAQLRQLELPESVKVDFVELDFANLQKIYDTTRQAVETLGERGIGSRKIWIDISGGCQLVAGAAASVALEKKRGYQYVDANYQVLVGDPVYETAEA